MTPKGALQDYYDMGPRMPVSTWELRCMLVLLLALHALSSALILPTLPLLSATHGGGNAQWAFSALILGFGVTQIPWGVLADQHGRRPTLLAGLLLFSVASISCVFTTQLWQLVACRFAQGAGAAAAGICARAIIRDLHTGEECVRVLSICFSWISMVALAGPPLAGLLISRYGMTGALLAYAAAGCCTLAVCLLRLPETMTSAHPGIRQDWGAILPHPVFRLYTALTTFSYVGNYVFLSGSSFLLMGKYGMSVVGYGVVLSASSLFYMLGTVACRRLVVRLGVPRTVCWASTIGLVATSAMLLSAGAGIGKAWATFLPYLGFIFAHAIHQSCGQGAAMTPFRHSAARASAMLGTILPVVAVSVGWLLAPALAESLIALPAAMFTAAALVAITAWLGVRRHGAIAPST